MEPSLAKTLCAHFALGQPRTIVTAGGTRNANYVLTTDRGRWFVRRRHPAYCEPERIWHDHAAASYLADRRVPVLPPRQSCEGATWSELDGAVWEVFPCVEGRHLRDGEAADVAALGAALAQWHQAGREFPLHYEKAAPRGEMDPNRLRERAKTLVAESPDTAEALRGYCAVLEWAAGDLPDSRYAALPHTLIHGDIQPANLVMQEGRIRAFVDLDWCGWQARLYDLCFAILICCASHADPFDGGDIRSLTQTPYLEADVVSAFLRAYTAEAGLLTAAECAALLPQLVLTWCHARIDGAFKVPAAERAAFLSRPPDMAALEWLVLPPLDSLWERS
ncbi:MAG TPA: phosphotransferase [Chthonomonadaceae bacterium]|nr:phosphotransferase [Chthonomonadaceae bacterium]